MVPPPAATGYFLIPRRSIFSYRPLREIPSILAARVLLPWQRFRVLAMSSASMSLRVRPSRSRGGEASRLDRAGCFIFWGRSARVRLVPLERITERARLFFSSRTLPGQG